MRKVDNDAHIKAFLHNLTAEIGKTYVRIEGTADAICVTPYKSKETHVMLVKGIHALDLIAKSDKGRARHFATFTDWDWGDRSNYDLMVNSGSVGIDRSIEIICSCAEEMGL
jgi:hypothetical protein